MKKSGSKAMLILAVSIFGVYMGNAHVLRGNNKNTMLEMKAYSNCKVCQIYSKEGYTNVRKGPSKNYAIIDELYNGDIVSVVKTSGEWRYVSYHKYGSSKVNYGYIHVSQLRLASN